MVLAPLGWVAISDLRLYLARREARLTAAQKAELGALLDAREALGRRQVEAWNRASGRAALERLVLTDAGCPEAPAPPAPASAADYVRLGSRDSKFGDWSLCVLRPDAGEGACAAAYTVTPQLARVGGLLAEDDAHTWDLEELQAAAAPEPPPRAVVVVHQESPPKLRSAVVGQLSYNPGTLSGRAYLYLPRAERFVCGGEVSAHSSARVEAEFDDFGGKATAARKEEEGRAALQRDLEVRLRLAIPEGLRRLEER